MEFFLSEPQFYRELEVRVHEALLYLQHTTGSVGHGKLGQWVRTIALSTTHNWVSGHRKLGQSHATLTLSSRDLKIFISVYFILLYLFCITSYLFPINNSLTGITEGLTVSSINCDCWCQSKLVALGCHQPGLSAFLQLAPPGV